jgi:cytoskeletal protein CcmA (bactofilin family)
LKDEPKSISERATRFLAVDMKDRLKSAFNRSATGPAPASDTPLAEDAPDYSAMFAHRSPAAQKKTPISAPLTQTQLAEPTSSVTMRSPERQIAHDIEEAQIVGGAGNDPSNSPAWEAVSLKTRKVEAAAEGRRAAAPEIASDTDAAALFNGSKPANADRKVSPPPAPKAMLDSAAVAKPATEIKPVVKEEATPSIGEPRSPAVEVASSKHEEPVAPKSKFRFFNDSAESVRLKVEKRPEERPAPEPPPASTVSQAVTPPARPESRPVEIKPPSTQAAATLAARAPEPVELPKDINRVTTEAVAAQPVTSGQPNLKPQKENASMDAKGQENENGAGVKADSNAAGAAIAIERNSKFSGQLKFSGAIAIDGQVEGELVAERIVVHEGGVVNATVEGNTVVIAGNVKGDVYARNELEILPSGIVHGSVTAPAITVRRGGRVEGRCAIGVPRP